MKRKVLNNVVAFSACGKEAIFRLSDRELKELRCYTDFLDKSGNSGSMYNFSVFAFFDYETTRSKCGRFHSIFNYHSFEKIFWYII